MKLPIGLFSVFLHLAIAPINYGQNTPALPPVAKMANGAASFTMPFELVDNRIFINVRLNGQGPFKFILDTGGYGFISNETAHRLGLDLGAEVQGQGAGEKVVTARETIVKDVQIGKLRIANQDFRVFDFSDSRHVFGLKSFDGVIGLPVFERMVVRVDYQRNLLTVTRPSSFNYHGRGTVVPFTLERFLPLVRGEIDGISGIFGIDTGDRSTLTLKGPFIESYHMTAKYNPRVEAITGWGIGGPIRTQVVRAKKFTFGGFELRNPVTRLSLQRSGAFVASDAAGNIGAGILKQFTVTFDYTRRQVIFEKNSNYGQPDRYDRSGMWISQTSDKKSFEITEVIANGPAALIGLKVGDKIMAIDGQETDRLGLVDARIKLKNSQRDRVRLLVLSGTLRRTVTLTLRDLV